MAWPYRSFDLSPESTTRFWADVDIYYLQELKTINELKLLAKDEREFQLLLTANQNLQRRLGWAAILVNQVRYPDLSVLLQGGDDRLNIELEYSASNFVRHNHGAGGCDLILSLTRHSSHTMIRGIPVWSFFVVDGEALRWSLDSDISHNGQDEDFALPDDDFFDETFNQNIEADELT